MADGLDGSYHSGQLEDWFATAGEKLVHKETCIAMLHLAFGIITGRATGLLR